MCGIIGACGDCAKDDPAFRELLAAMAHRGPDAQGVWSGEQVVVGHRRLAIIDLRAESNQPAVNDAHVLVYNGEIYNYAEIAPQQPGDLLALAREDQLTEHPEKLRGMFSYASWWSGGRRLTLVRDRFGMKPMYVSAGDSGMHFSSYARTTARLAGRVKLDRRSLASYLRFGSVYGPGTMFEGVTEHAPGHLGSWTQEDGLTSRAYWAFPPASERTSAQDVADAVSESLRAHVIADVPVALFLSAGVDSTVLAVLAAEAGLNVTALTVGLPGNDLDESREARMTATRLGLEHRVLDLQAEDVDFDGYFAATDQPSIDGLNTYLVSKAAAEAGFRVALSGLGADEIFAGYSLFRRIPTIAAAGLLPRAVRSRLLRRTGNGAKVDDFLAAGSDLSSLYAVSRALRTNQQVQGLIGLSAEGPRLPSEGFHRPITRLTQLELLGYLRNTLLRDADVFGMAHSLEIRTPFVDHQLLATAMGRPELQRVISAKRDLKRILADRGLEHVVHRKKTGFQLPFAEWLAGPLSSRVNGLASGPLPDVLTSAGRADLDDAARGHHGSMQLWSLVALDAWLRRESQLDFS